MASAPSNDVCLADSNVGTRRLLLGMVLVVAAVVRLWGVQHDFPTSYYQDEMHFVQRAVSFGSGDLNPHWFHKPAFYMYVLFFEYGLFFLTGYATQHFTSVDAFAVSFVQNPWPFILIGRLTTLTFSLATILAVYRIGERHIGEYAGIAGATILALTFGEVESSRVIKADAPSACFCIWSAYFLLHYQQDRRMRSLLGAVVLAALSAATKYYGLAMLLPIGLSVLASDADAPGLRARVTRGMKTLSLVAVIFLATFLVCSPFNLLDERGRVETISPVMKLVDKVTVSDRPTRGSEAAFIAEQEGIPGGIVDYANVLIAREGMGTPLGLICIVGVVAMIGKGGFAQRLFLLFPIAFAAASIISFPGYAEPRHLCPIYPFLAVAGGGLVSMALRWSGRQPVFAMVGLLVLGAIPIGHLAARGMELSKEDTRNVSKLWLEEHIPSGALLIVSENGPPLLSSPSMLAARIKDAEKADPRGQFTAHYARYLQYQALAAEDQTHYRQFEIRVPWWRETFRESGTHRLDAEYDRDMANPLKPVGIESYDTLRNQGYEYAVVHSDQYDSLLRPEEIEQPRYPAYTLFYQELMQRGELLQEFSPGPEWRGPVVRVYSL